MAEGSDITLHAALTRLSMLGLGARQCISIGAGSGSDTMFAARVLNPKMPILMVDAQRVHEAALGRLATTESDVKYVICAAAEKDGRISFDASSPSGGAILLTHKDDSEIISARSIDSLVAEFELDGPFFVKFDTHGAELQILAGAELALSKTALIMMEVYNFKLNSAGRLNLTFDEMCVHLKTIGFRMVDLCLPLHRPGDGVFWQAHFFFIRSNHHVFGSNSYSAKAPSRVPD